MKFVLIAIIVIGAALSIKPIRVKLDPVLHPISSRLEPKLAKVKNGPKRWATKNEERVLLRRVAEQYNETKKLPSASGFTLWIKTNTRGGNKGVDAWGSNYYLLHETGKVIIGSRGPDKVRNTPDDITVSAPIGN